MYTYQRPNGEYVFTIVPTPDVDANTETWEWRRGTPTVYHRPRRGSLRVPFTRVPHGSPPSTVESVLAVKLR